jgi:hypothetical protein
MTSYLDLFSQLRLDAERDRTQQLARDAFVAELLSAVTGRFPTAVLEVESTIFHRWETVLAGECIFQWEYKTWNDRRYRLRDLQLPVILEVSLQTLVEELGLRLPTGPRDATAEAKLSGGPTSSEDGLAHGGGDL